MLRLNRQTGRCFGFAVILLALSLQAGGAEYFVASDGADGNSGSEERPFRTIQKAADTMKAGDTCYVRGGVYRQVVRPKGSGSENKPIRFKAWPGEVVVLCGTEPINGKWSLHKGKIYKTTVTDVFDQLFVNGRMMIEARWPNMRFEQRFDKAAWATAGKGSEYGTMVDPKLAETGIDWTGAVATLNVGSWQTYRRIVRDHKRRGDSFKYEQDMPGHVESKRKWEGFDHYYLADKLQALDMPTDWMRVRTVTLGKQLRNLSLRFAGKHLGNAKISDVSDIEAPLGKVVPFDRPAMPAEPASFARPSKSK